MIGGKNGAGALHTRIRPFSVSRISGKGAWIGAQRDGCAKTRVLAKVDKVGMKT
jgi:hypothetical protein